MGGFVYFQSSFRSLSPSPAMSEFSKQTELAGYMRVWWSSVFVSWVYNSDSTMREKSSSIAMSQDRDRDSDQEEATDIWLEVAMKSQPCCSPRCNRTNFGTYLQHLSHYTMCAR